MVEYEDIIKEHIKQFYSGTLTERQRNECWLSIDNILNKWIDINIKRYNLYSYSDIDIAIDEIKLLMIDKVLPYIYSNESNINNVSDYIFITIKNFFSKVKINKYKLFIEYGDDIIDDTLQDEIEKGYVIYKVVNEIDSKIKRFEVVNSLYCVILIELRNYIIEFEDVRGFKDYVIQKYNISKTHYSSFIRRTGIYSKYLNERLTPPYPS